MCHFGILLTWTSEEGHPLFKEEVVEYFPYSPSIAFRHKDVINQRLEFVFPPVVFLEEATVCKDGNAFCFSVFSVK